MIKMAGRLTSMSPLAERKFLDAYNVLIKEAELVGIQKSAKVGFSHGVLYSTAFFVYGKKIVCNKGSSSPDISFADECLQIGNYLLVLIFCMFLLLPALAFYYGTNLVADDLPCVFAGRNDCITGGVVITAFFAFLIGSFSLGQLAPSLKAVSVARASMVKVMKIIKREPLLDSTSTAGLRPEHVKGDVEVGSHHTCLMLVSWTYIHVWMQGTYVCLVLWSFWQFNVVNFAYPARLNNRVCDNYKLSVKAGDTVALVGPSGGGKSTAISLLLRFYDPIEGSIMVRLVLAQGYIPWHPTRW